MCTSLIPVSLPGIYLTHTSQKTVFDPILGPGWYVSKVDTRPTLVLTILLTIPENIRDVVINTLLM
jgi:hypothetical protein